MPHSRRPSEKKLPAAVLALLRKYPSLPRAYTKFLAESGGAEGPLGVDPGWFVIWPPEDALTASDKYEVAQYVPGYFAFGSNGGGELFIINIEATDEQRPVYMAPAIGMSPEELIEVAPSFTAFASEMGKDEGD
jgi:hypothetical protein